MAPLGRSESLPSRLFGRALHSKTRAKTTVEEQPQTQAQLTANDHATCLFHSNSQVQLLPGAFSQGEVLLDEEAGVLLQHLPLAR